jgi:hypothetical protein
MDPDRARGLFDRAVALFNDRAFYEAHEDWETLWHEAEGAERLWLQGLIQWAAAFFHYERGYHASGFAKLLREGADKAIGYEGDAHGIRFDALVADMRPWLAHGEAVARGRDLRGKPPEDLPRIRYAEGVTPAPLPPEEPDDPGR